MPQFIGFAKFLSMKNIEEMDEGCEITQLTDTAYSTCTSSIVDKFG